ncbi:hypothetical protein AK830_g9569 [Neonectria ditissima]|uniref:Protection of telomeres protein 1 n=1 Tax=Neonectria ditissima TaxID=78410 RepID=A0A0P7AUH0_9HYPO|nr:hypothetical protein AK830_g9569 [Neonectria ditissima]
MSPSQHPAQAMLSAIPQVPDIVTVHDILEGNVQTNARVNTIGIITDFRAPIPTRGTGETPLFVLLSAPRLIMKDYKCAIQFYDLSVQDDGDSSLRLNVFRPEKEMPVARCGDVILIVAAKVQRLNMESPSLITNRTTQIHIYLAAKIPKPPSDALCALRPSAKSPSRHPSDVENAYVSYMYHSINKDRIPTEQEFDLMVIQSTNVKDKFSQLEGVVDGRFYDIVVQVVKEPYDQGDKVTIWVSDYTENLSFFHYAFLSSNSVGEPKGDSYGYTKRNKTRSAVSKGDWAGPFGKRSMQITCFEPHATAIRQEKISAGSWVMIRNLQAKWGHNASNLEGYLREDRAAHGPKLGIRILDSDDPETIDPRLKDALRRKRDYERTKKEQIKDISDAAKAGQKRKADVVPTGPNSVSKKNNTKQRRAARRAQAQNDEEKANAPPVITDLNSQADLLEPITHDTSIDGQPVKLKLPFVNTNYRANVRVVNFMPPNLKDFSFAKKSSEYDILSDNDDADGASDSEQDMMADFTTIRNWEWRFYLELEDAAVLKGQQKNRVWVAVDNQAAQCLMNLDASNLRHDADNLEALRQRLFLLWGELEEHKSREQTKKAKSIKAAREGRPPMDSSDEEEAAGPKGASKAPSVNHRPFACCIRQYGVRVQERDETKADAGKGRRWQRMFGLFGTRIAQ